MLTEFTMGLMLGYYSIYLNIPCFVFQGTIWSPSKIITRLGLEIKDESSIYYWAAKNQVAFVIKKFLHNILKKDQL